MKYKIGFSLLGCLMFSLFSFANNMSFSGNLIIPNCTINNGQPISVEFGDVEIQTFTAQLASVQPKQFNIPVNCPYSLGQAKISVTGPKGSAVNALQTDKYAKEKLAILLWTGTTSTWSNLPIGGQFTVVHPAYISGSGVNKMLAFRAALTREGDMALLKPGPFTAAANLVLRYE